jgi:hypothetical protein
MKSNFLTSANSRKFKEQVVMPMFNRLISSTLIACVCLVSSIQASPAQANPKVDQAIKKALDQASLTYSITEKGDFRVVYALNSGRKHTVVIDSLTSDLKTSDPNKSMRIRRVYSFIPPFENGISQETKKQLLQDSNQKKIGSWTSNKPNEFTFTAKVDANLTPEDLKVITTWVAMIGDEMEQKLFGEDRIQ